MLNIRPLSATHCVVTIDLSAGAEPVEDGTTHARVIELLERNSVRFDLTFHEPVRTSEQAAALRGVTLASGAKAMLLSVRAAGEPDGFVLVVVSAADKMDSKALRKEVGLKSTRFATEEEVLRITGCIPGAVPPFGSVWGLRTFVDAGLEEQGAEINFNVGLRTRSVSMSVADYLRVEAPTLVHVT